MTQTRVQPVAHHDAAEAGPLPLVKHWIGGAADLRDTDAACQPAA